MQEAIIPATDSKSIFSVIFLVFIDSSIELDISTYAESAVAAFQPFLDIQWLTEFSSTAPFLSTSPSNWHKVSSCIL